MSQPRPSFEVLFNQHNRWSLSNDGLIKVTKPGRGVFDLVYFSDPDEYADIHPYLPEKLTSLLTVHHTILNKTFATGLDIKANVDLLKYGKLEFVDIYARHRLVTSVRNLLLIGEDESEVWLDAAELTFTDYDLSGGTFPLVSARQVCCDVHNAELETRYPGWKMRWKLGQDLGMPHEELMSHVFVSNASLSSDLKDIKF